ncbi:MAG: carboxylesterase/lipase family protein [Firmicutes bacterium]|nr:carboxylesterase/lipase family protein [Bacillota bacterium]
MIRNTQYGKVEGFERNGVEVYYGIPYGKYERWTPCSDPDCFELLDCRQESPMAYQMVNNKIEGCHDCLNLDIYTQSHFKNRPVLVFIHGGNNQTSHSTEIEGDILVTKNEVVYVSINYRLGLLGFNNLPSIAHPTGNFAMLDIAKSLEWIKNNISNFGGDPNNVTVSGFSAGGRDVMAMLISPTFKGLFEKAIVYSGGMTTCSQEEAQKKIADTLSSLVLEDQVCASKEEAVQFLLSDTEETREYLFSIDEKRLIPFFAGAAIRMARFPHLYEDDVVLPKGGFDNPCINDVPVLMVTGSEEFSMFGIFDSNFQSIKDKEKSTTFLLKHGGDFYRNFNTQHSALNLKGYQSNIYVCQINYGDLESSHRIVPFGSFHGIFVPMFVDKGQYYTLYDFHEKDYQNMANCFHTYLKQFLETGTCWPAWTKENKNTLVLDGNKVEIKDVYMSNAEIIENMNRDPLNKEDKEILIHSILNGRWFSSDLDAYYKNPSLW